MGGAVALDRSTSTTTTTSSGVPAPGAIVVESPDPGIEPSTAELFHANGWR